MGVSFLSAYVDGRGLDIGGLTEKIREIPDPRRAWGNLRHKLEDIFVIGLAMLLCGGEDFEDMEEFGRSREQELRKFVELPHGIPDESTFFRVFTRVKGDELSRCVYEWLGEVKGGAGPDQEIVLGQLAVAEKTNEITAMPKLLELPDD